MLRTLKITDSHALYKRLRFAAEKEVTLSFSPGVNIISGVNGAGKSTLFAILHEALFIQEQPGVSVESASVPHYFFSMKDLDAKTMMREAPDHQRYDPRFISTWMERGAQSHGQMNFSTLEDVIYLLEQDEPVVIFIDEPELALDAKNLVKLAKVLKRVTKAAAPKVQCVINSHHPFLLLDDTFNHIELDHHCRQEAFKYLVRLIRP